jgi:endonuclease YncB( thermonuclease family)
MNFSSITLGLFFAIMLAIPTLADVYKVNEVVDGDTIKVVNIQDNFAKKVRLACIDSPEGDQPPGKLSTTTLKAFIVFCFPLRFCSSSRS